MSKIPNDELIELYTSTVVQIHVENEILSESQCLKLWGHEYFILTASNPLSQLLSDAENASRNTELEKDLIAIGAPTFFAVGKSEDESWVEEGFATFGVDIEKILELGRKYNQHSIFHVNEHGRNIVNCFE